MVRIVCKPLVRMIYLYSFGHASAVICFKYSVISCNECEKLTRLPRHSLVVLCSMLTGQNAMEMSYWSADLWVINRDMHRLRCAYYVMK